ncbi:ribonuclease HIII [Candidatus Similichlamydia epinepheli]|uniref:ribonuclease HIII n=1 Tax=Candidatus Similichlamydia epinepheli TaxID=1903953 RepID=UPI000D37817A|nr:ribonuclease HIII [Candidatus Similichlamydia epinepheli]
MSVHVFQLDNSKWKLLETFLLDNGFVQKKIAPHVVFLLQKSGVSCCLYESGKCTVQGKEGPFQEFIEFVLEPFLEDFSYSLGKIEDSSVRIGTDESGKGDLFGPLCVTAVFIDTSTEQKLKKLGVRDSKKLSDQRAISLAQEIREICRYRSLRLVPSTYNRLYDKFGNLNLLLGWAHAKVVADLIKETGTPDKLVVDQFAKDQKLLERAFAKENINVPLEQRFRAESDISVAAASVISRAIFLDWIKDTSEKIGLLLHKGSGEKSQDSLEAFMNREDTSLIFDIAKMHFKQIKEISTEKTNF